MKLFLLLLLVLLLEHARTAQECQKIENCGPLFRKPPSCTPNKTEEAIVCMQNSCEGNTTAIKQVLEVHQSVIDLICSNSKPNDTDSLQAAFQMNKGLCWVTAVACARGHIIGDKADPTPEICYMRKHGIEQCEMMAGPTCSNVINRFFTLLYSESKCRGHCNSGHVFVVAVVTLLTLARSQF